MEQPAVTETQAAPPDGSWTAPGAFRVGPGVHRIPLPLGSNGLRAVNVYAVEDGDALVLIDSGWALALARTRLEEGLAAIGRGLGDVTRFLMTHMHTDHYSQAVVLRREFGIRFGVGLGERPSLELWADGREGELAPQLRRLNGCGAAPVAKLVRSVVADRAPTDLTWELPDEWLVPGDIPLEARTLEAVATPGHTRGHLCFRDAAHGLLFAGDHVLPTITPSLGFEPALPGLPLADFLASLRLIRSQPDAVLLPAHGPVRPSVHARVDDLLAHHAVRLGEAEQAVCGGAATAYEVARLLTWTSRKRRLSDMDPFNQMLAVLETCAHLDLLVVQGRCRAQVSDGVTGYLAR
ncbi:MAG TPA: MBL fold metallo-hydrolase [Trebonia sp.]|jgi:glyoxylase-like metal-dependent hydrolase (beta-lactamase superfamily II)|nr:MBL fold metallo-hydrolase [Trebonia sp.]